MSDTAVPLPIFVGGLDLRCSRCRLPFFVGVTGEYEHIDYPGNLCEFVASKYRIILDTHGFVKVERCQSDSHMQTA
jgi:hypothetical protein